MLVMHTTEVSTQTGVTLPVWTTGEHLTKAREHAGIDIDGMAGRLGVSARTIRNYENEAVRITRATLIAYAEITSVPLEWLLGEDDPDVRNRCSRRAPPFDVNQRTLFALAA
jgi:transcriptional regulator with XRE-family HTH domain